MIDGLGREVTSIFLLAGELKSNRSTEHGELLAIERTRGFRDHEHVEHDHPLVDVERNDA